MRAPFSKLTPARALGLAALALLPLGSTVWFAMGQLEPADRAVPAAPTPTRPSYLVAVREPTPEEMAQRRALAEVETDRHVLQLALSQPADLRPGLDVTEPATPTARVTTAVNVRSGPGTDNAVLRVAAAGDAVTVVEQSGGWSRITTSGGEDGWVASRFLEQ